MSSLPANTLTVLAAAGIDPSEISEATVTPDGWLRATVRGFVWVLPPGGEEWAVRMAQKLATEKAARVQEVVL